MTKKSLPTVKVVYVNPNKYDRNEGIIYLGQNSKSIFAYSGGIHKYLNERIIPDLLTKSDPMVLKKFNFAAMYKDHLLTRAKGMVTEWKEFLKQDEVTIGVLYPDFVDTFQSVIEEVTKLIASDIQFQTEEAEASEYESESELAYI